MRPCRPVTLIRPSRPNAYTGNPLDRAVSLRDDVAWVDARLADPDSIFVPIWRGRSLLRGMDAARPEPVFLTGEAAAACRMAGGPWAFLGLLRGVAVFAVDLSAAEDPIPLLPPDLGSFEELRRLPGALAPEDASILAHARGMMHWRNRTLYCSVCGTACDARSAGHVMACPNCGTQHFPRTDPAVIMLAIRDDRCLLGHAHRFPHSRMYSTLAGFVEPGESLEEAVAREVFEEAAIRVGRVFYHSSQPWPFPASLMLGFYAEALTEEITVETAELQDVRWFSRAQIADPEAHGFSLPGEDSIARRLIEDWLAA